MRRSTTPPPGHLVVGGVVEGLGPDAGEVDEQRGGTVHVGVLLHGAHGVQQLALIICRETL